MRVWLAILFATAMLLVGCNAAGTVPPASSGLRITTEIYPPYNFVDKNNNVTGQSTEIVQAILENTGTRANIEVMPLSQGLAIAEKGPEVVIYSLNRTPLRENLFKWVGPIGYYEQAFYAKKGTTITINELEDAKKVNKIGIYKGDAGAQFLASQGFTNLDESLTDAEALKKLMDGTVQLWLGNKDGLAITAAQAGVNPDDLVMMPTVVIQADLYIAFSKDVPDSTVTAWQSALDALKQEKDIDYKTVYEKIMAKYSDPEYINSLMGQ
ncbi:MAG: transporter substrate-binding domain-containing protein [Dehalococcoidia bacterium]